MSYVALTVRARIRGFDWTLEEAAMDLGATPLRTFRKVTLPLIAPGIVAAAMLAFALSLDDFIITLLQRRHRASPSRSTSGARARRTPPQINVLGSMIFLIAVGLMLANVLIQRRRDA